MSPATVPSPSRPHFSQQSLTPLSRGWLILVPHHLAQAQALSGQAKRAELYREEAEALRERAGRLPRLQEELRRCRERLQAAEVFKGQLEVRWGRGCGRSTLGAWSRGGACRRRLAKGGVGPTFVGETLLAGRNG